MIPGLQDSGYALRYAKKIKTQFAQRSSRKLAAMQKADKRTVGRWRKEGFIRMSVVLLPKIDGRYKLAM
jgi:hypothetical protein